MQEFLLPAVSLAVRACGGRCKATDCCAGIRNWLAADAGTASPIFSFHSHHPPSLPPPPSTPPSPLHSYLSWPPFSFPAPLRLPFALLALPTTAAQLVCGCQRQGTYLLQTPDLISTGHNHLQYNV